jgi:hypothetical protein
MVSTVAPVAPQQQGAQAEAEQQRRAVHVGHRGEHDPCHQGGHPHTRTRARRGPAGDSSQAPTVPSNPAAATKAPASGGSHR